MGYWEPDGVGPSASPLPASLLGVQVLLKNNRNAAPCAAVTSQAGAGGTARAVVQAAVPDMGYNSVAWQALPEGDQSLT